MDDFENHLNQFYENMIQWEKVQNGGNMGETEKYAEQQKAIGEELHLVFPPCPPSP